MKSHNLSQPKRKKSKTRKSSAQSKSNKSKSRQRSSRSHSRSKQSVLLQTGFSQTKLRKNIIYNDKCEIENNRSHSRKNSGKFQIKLVQKQQNPNHTAISAYNSFSNTKLNSVKKHHHRSKHTRESLDLTQIQQRQQQEKSMKQKMFENTVNDYHSHNKQIGNNDYSTNKSYYQYEQNDDRPRSLNIGNSRSNSRDRSYHQQTYNSNMNTPQSKNNHIVVNNYLDYMNDRINTQQSDTNTDIKNKQQQVQKHDYKSQNTQAKNNNSQAKQHNEQREYYSQLKSYNEENSQNLNYDQLYKELAKYKQKVYDYKYKNESLYKRLIESKDQCQEWKEKFEREQDKTDEFFSKAEKYKLLTKDFRKDNDMLKQQLEDLNLQHQQEYNNYETILKLKDQKEQRTSDELNYLQQKMIENLRTLQIVASQIDKNCLLIDPINQLFENIQQLQFINENTNTLQQSKPFNDITLSQDFNQSLGNNQMFYISEGKDKFKISSDAIMFNGESLNPDEYINQEQLNHKTQQQQNVHLNDQSNQNHNINTIQQTPKVIMLHDKSQSDQHDSHAQLLLQQNNANQFTSQLHNISQTQQQTQQQYDILLKIQQEMIQLKEQSQKVLEENQNLQNKNTKLQEELEQQKQRSEQSLMPQYKDAFEQLRKTNENMQRKIEILEQERINVNKVNEQVQIKEKDQSISKIESDLREMQNQIQKISYENQNLRSEREQFVNQISNLENFNKKQEKMLQYFQQQNQNSHQSSYISTNYNLPLKIQENYEAQTSYLSNNHFQRKNSNQSLINSASTNNMRSKMSRILDQQINVDQPSNLSDFSKSPHSQYISNRTGGGQDIINQVQRFTLNQVTQSEFELTQSIMNKTNNSKINTSAKGPALTMTQFQPNGTQQSDLYIDTTVNDQTNMIVIEQNENLFSLSSTQPENQMRLSSPINYLVKDIDFNLNNPNSTSNAQHYQLNTGNFKQSTMKDATQYSNLQLNQYKNRNPMEINIQPLSTQHLQNRSRSPIDQLRVHEIMQTQSQEVTNRDKSGGRMINQSTTQGGQSTLQKSNSELSNTQLPCVILAQGGLQNSFYEMQEQHLVNNDQSAKSFKLNSNLNELSSDSQNTNSDRSLEQHLIRNRANYHQNSKQQSQETFQGKNANVSINSQYQPMRIKNDNQYLNNYTTAQKHNKKNLIMVDEEGGMKNHQYSQQSKILNSKVKSPAFYESNHMNSDSEINNTFNNNDNYNQAYFNQQIILDGLINKVGINPNQSDSYCTTDKQNTLSSGFLSNITQSVGIQENNSNLNGGKEIDNLQGRSFANNSSIMNQNNVNASLQSNFMSDRTMNLKKEINSLDEEIYQLQNSLKQALIKKTNQLEESID